MAYIINRYNGTVLTSVEDGTVDQTTELKLIGKNFAGYGEAQNENFLHLLEHFSNSSAPTKPLTGMLWYDNTSSKIKVYDGSKWKSTGGGEVSATAPTGLVEGDLWWNNSTNQLFAKNASNEWVLVGPQGAGTGVTQMQSLTLTDTFAQSHAVIAGTIEDDVIFIISSDEFTISAGDAITGFDIVKRGLTLTATQAATNGSTTGAGTVGGPIIWGTASNALKLGGEAASNYLLKDDAVFTDVVSFADAGITIGDSNDLKIYIESGTIGAIENQVGSSIKFYIKDTTQKNIANITAAGFIPGVSLASDLGSSSLKWNNVYATTFNGTATQADTLNVSGTYRSASTAAAVNTIAARDSSGNLTAVLFSGTATQARYADLAEKYTTETELPAGTAVAVCSHTEHEVEPASAHNFCIGVVSTNPAIMMNSEAEGQYIALKGRVPVRVKGAVKKGQPVYAMASGVCTTLATTALVGVALESNDSDDEKLVECVLKV